MIVLNCDKIKKSFGMDCILDNVTFSAKLGDRIGIVGDNGSGKSTLLKILYGILSYDEGNIYKSDDYSMGYLAQETVINSDSTIWNELLSVFNHLHKIEEKLYVLEKKISTFDVESVDEYIMKEYGDLRESYERLGGYSYESYIRGVLSGLGFSTEQYHHSISTLSGGQKTRVALAKLLLIKPDILLLDEPTNHLDLDSLQWLEEYIKGYSGTVMIVSHDRYFLDNTCTSILELENKNALVFNGNYSSYRSLKNDMILHLAKEHALAEKEINRQKAIIKQFKSFNREKSIKAAESRQKKLDKIELKEKPYIAEQINLNFSVEKASGNDVLSIESLSKSFDNSVIFNNINLSVFKGDRIGIIGPNGCGKTTLFKILLGKIKATSGSIRIGTGVSIGYYDQEQSSLNPGNSIIDELWNTFPRLTHTEIRNTLASFLFKGDDVHKKIDTLSGGERGRLILAKLALAKNNLLLLDEPTNHLDMASKEQLENSLASYPGTILVISHDRYFLNKIANKIALFESGKITEYIGNYDDYIHERNKQALLYNEKTIELRTKTEVKEEKKRSRQARINEKKHKETILCIENDIKCIENRISCIEQELSQPSIYENPDIVMQLNIEYGENKRKLETLYEEWFQIQEKT